MYSHLLQCFTSLILISSVFSNAVEVPSVPFNDSQISPDLLMDAFETFRKLILESARVDEKDNSVQHYSSLQRLDPLYISKAICHESRDSRAPILGKTVIKLSNLQFSGLSSFKVEKVRNSGPCLDFTQTIPQLDACGDYTIEYHLFDEIPLRLSEGQLKATIPKARISGGFLSAFGNWPKRNNFNLTTTFVEDIALMVYPKYTISERYVLNKNMDKFEAAVRSALPELSEILKGAYARVIEMKLMA